MMRVLTKNIGWKLLALGCSVALWYTFAGETEVATSVPVVFQYRNVPSDLEINSEPVDRLFLKLRGPASRLSTSDLAQISVSMDIGAVHTPGEHTFSIGPANLGLPAGVTLVRAVPSQVRLLFERRSSKYVPIDIRYSGPPPKDYRVAAQTAFPRAVRVVGPESRVTRIETVSTDAIDLSAAVGTVEFRVPLFISDPEVRLEPPVPLAAVRVTLERIPQ